MRRSGTRGYAYLVMGLAARHSRILDPPQLQASGVHEPSLPPCMGTKKTDRRWTIASRIVEEALCDAAWPPRRTHRRGTRTDGTLLQAHFEGSPESLPAASRREDLGPFSRDESVCAVLEAPP